MCELSILLKYIKVNEGKYYHLWRIMLPPHIAWGKLLCECMTYCPKGVSRKGERAEVALSVSKLLKIEPYQTNYDYNIDKLCV